MRISPVLYRLAPWQWGLAATMLAALLALAACGGGSAGSASSSSGTLATSITDGPSSDFSHAYVAINQISLHTSASAVDLLESPGWVHVYLPNNPVVDLNNLNNGQLASILSGADIPAATYAQIRLNLMSWDAATVSTTQSLPYNAAVVEANGNAYPLEIANPDQGLALLGSFTVRADHTLNLAIEFNVGDDIVRFRHGAGYAYMLNPTLHGYDRDQSGSISGYIACNPLCANFVVKAEQLSADGTYYQVARWTNVQSDGSFTLSPVPVSGSSQSYDIVVRGRNARTTIIQSVPVTSNSTTVLASAATPVPVQASNEYTVSTSAANPTASNFQFYQTVPGTSAPYEIRFRQTDPFSGTFLAAEPVVDGDLLVGPYQSNGNPGATLVSHTPTEGAGAYQIWLSAPDFTRTQASSISPSASTISAPAGLTLGNGVAALGQVNLTLTPTTPHRWDHGQLVITRFGAVVNSADISSLVGLGGVASVSGLPSGTTAQPFPVGYYFAYLRLWNSNAAAPNQVHIVPVSGFADLRQSASATMAATLP